LESFFINNCNFAFVSRLTADDDSKCAPDMLTPDDKFFFSDLTYIPIFQSKFGACMSSKSSLLYIEEFTPIYTHTVQHPMTLFPTRHLKMSDRILFITSTPEKHIQAITENNAICNIPYFAYKYYFGNEENIVFRPYDNNVMHTHYLVYPKNHTLTKAEHLFIEAFAKYLSQMKQS
jgi:DNA-binding transcriptional LysR family regulator